MDSLLNAAQWARITVCFARLIGQGGGGGGGPPASIATKKLGLQDDTWPCMSHERKCVGAGMRVSVDIRVRVSGGITAPPSSAGAQLTLTPPPKVHVCQISGDSWSRWLRAAFRPSRETKPRDPPPQAEGGGGGDALRAHCQSSSQQEAGSCHHRSGGTWGVLVCWLSE